MNKKLLVFMIVFSFIGLATTSYQAYEHYFLSESFCDFSEGFSCDHITNSQYGEFPFESGIATSLWGILWWGLFIFALFMIIKNKKMFDYQEFYTFLWMVFGLSFVIYLLIVELYLLPAQTGILVICPLCTVQHVLIISLFIMSFKLLKKPINLYIREIF